MTDLQKQSTSPGEKPNLSFGAPATGEQLTDTLSPDLFFDMDAQQKKAFQEIVRLAQEILPQWQSYLESRHADKYAQLQSIRGAEGKSVPPLATILHNLQLSPKERSEQSTELILRQFGDLEQIKTIYADPSKLTEWKQRIQALHDKHVAQGLDAFELGEHPILISAGMNNIQTFLGTAPAQTRNIYEALADHGYIGTIEEIRELQSRIRDIKEYLDVDSFDATISILGGCFFGSLLYLLGCLIFGTIGKGGSLPFNYYLIALTRLLTSVGIDKMSEVPVTVAGLYYLPKKRILTSKLKTLEDKQALLEITQRLLPEVTGVTQTYADLDSMSVTQLQELITRLGNIKNLLKCTFEGGKKFDFIYLDILSSEDLEDLVGQIKQIDHQVAQKKLEQIVSAMTQGNHNPEVIKEFKKQFREKIEKEAQLPVPMDLIQLDETIKPENIYKILQAFDELVGMFTLSEEQKHVYEKMKDEVTVGERDNIRKNIQALQTYVTDLSQSQQNHRYTLDWREVKEETEEQLKELGLSEGSIDALISMARLGSPDFSKEQKPSELPTTHSNLHEVPLDLNELKKVIEDRKKTKELVELKSGSGEIRNKTLETRR